MMILCPPQHGHGGRTSASGDLYAEAGVHFASIGSNSSPRSLLELGHTGGAAAAETPGVMRLIDAPDCGRSEWSMRIGRQIPSTPLIDSAVDFQIDGSAMTEMHRDRETDCREEVCGEAQR